MTSQPALLESLGEDPWTNLVGSGVINAISGMSEMVGQDIKITSFNAKTIKIKDAASLVGGPEAETAAVYLSGTGPAVGHMVLMYSPQTAFDLIDMLMGEPKGVTTSLGEFEASALAEVGNIVGSFFLNALSDATGLDLRVSTPSVLMDMAGSVLDAILAEIMTETDEALVVEAVFGTSSREISGTFLSIPTLELQDALLSNWRQE